MTVTRSFRDIWSELPFPEQDPQMVCWAKLWVEGAPLSVLEHALLQLVTEFDDIVISAEFSRWFASRADCPQLTPDRFPRLLGNPDRKDFEDDVDFEIACEAHWHEFTATIHHGKNVSASGDFRKLTFYIERESATSEDGSFNVVIEFDERSLPWGGSYPDDWIVWLQKLLDFALSLAGNGPGVNAGFSWDHGPEVTF